jgi:hypothetical protein
MATNVPSTPQSEPIRANPAEERTNPFVGIDVSGFEPVKVTVARSLEEQKEETAAAALTEAASAELNRGEDYKGLQPSESLWDEGMSRKRRQNIVGGWA